MKLRRIVVVILWVGVGVTLMAATLWRMDLHRLAGIVGKVSFGWLALALVADVACLLCKALKWRLMLSPVGRASVLRLQGAYYAAGAVSMVVPFRLDEFVRAYVATRFTGLPGPKVLGSMAPERLVDLVALLAALSMLAFVVPVPDWLTLASRSLGVVVVTAAVVLACLQLVSSKLENLRGRVGGLIRDFVRGGDALRRPGLMAGGLGLSILEWVANVAAILMVIQALGVDLPFAAALLITCLFAASYVLPLAPAGIGVFEVAVMLALPALYPVDEETAVALALVAHAVLLLLTGTIGATVVIGAGVKMRDVRRWRDETARG